MQCGKHPSETRGREIKKSSGMKQIINQVNTGDVSSVNNSDSRELL